MSASATVLGSLNSISDCYSGAKKGEHNACLQ